MVTSSVDCGERVMRYFRFRSGSHFGSKKVFFGQFLGSQTSRTSQGRAQNQEAANQRLSLAQAWPLYIYTIERWEGEQRGATSGQKKGGFGLFLGVFGSQTSRTSREMEQKQEGGQSEAEFGSDLAFIYIHNRENICISIFD